MSVTQDSTYTIDGAWVRSQFPSLALTQEGRPVVYLDNPAGTQVPERAIAGIAEYLRTSNANVHGSFLTSRRTDDLVTEVRRAMADFLGAASPGEIVFGPNMTTLTFAVSRALGRDFAPGDEIIVTDLDHDANITPWRALEERGVVIKRVPVRLEDCTLDMEAYGALLSPRTRLVAVTAASNAVGTVPDVTRIARMAHDAGALIWVDAVHYGPHGLIDVQAMEVDFLVCSAYKFFGPHLGILYGRAELLERTRAYQVRPAPQVAPDKFETGTKNHECLAGLLGTIEYLADLGRRASPGGGDVSRREALRRAMTAVGAYERTLSARLLQGLSSVPGLRIYGIKDPSRLAERVPTFSFTIDGYDTLDIGRVLGEEGIFSWTGNYYALSIMESLGLEGKGGALRVGAVHYNTPEEIDRLVSTLKARFQPQR